MRKSGAQYGREVRELRAAGFDFPPGRGYTLANPSQWSVGQKSAVTRAVNFNKRSITAKKGAATRARNKAAELQQAVAVGQGLSDDIAEEFFEDAAGDNFEEWDDINFFDFDEAEEFQDEEGDQYEETT